jgi:hypothetical protein
MSESELWEEAQRHIKKLGSLSALFTTCIRALNVNEEENRRLAKTGISNAARKPLDRLLASPTVVAHLYYFTKELYPQRIPADPKTTPAQIAETYTPSELAVLLTIAYLYRILKQKIDPEHWKLFAVPMRKAIALGALLGTSIPSIGLARGALTGSLRYFAWGLFTVSDKEKMKKYRVNLRVKKIASSLEMEREDWMTTHAHVGSLVLQTFGFGIEGAGSYLNGLIKSLDEVSEIEQKFRVTQLWIDSLLLTGAPPKESIGDEYSLGEGSVDAFVSTVHAIAEEDDYDRWLDKSRGDLSSEKTPNLDYNYDEMLKRHGAAKSTEDE